MAFASFSVRNGVIAAPRIAIGALVNRVLAGWRARNERWLTERGS